MDELAAPLRCPYCSSTNLRFNSHDNFFMGQGEVFARAELYCRNCLATWKAEIRGMSTGQMLALNAMAADTITEEYPRTVVCKRCKRQYHIAEPDPPGPLHGLCLYCAWDDLGDIAMTHFRRPMLPSSSPQVEEDAPPEPC